MTPERWEKIKELFDAALERAPEQRTAFLAEACAGNDSLAQEVQRLLAEHDRAGEFLDPATWLKGAILNPAFESIQPTGDGEATRTNVSVGAPEAQGGLLQAGESFANRYEVKGELGRGGFGIVYAAFDRGPLQRTVALKVIRFAPGEPTQPTVQARQRFLEEARVAGNLSHNNIATVYDVGEFSGSVYMTQELAPGRDLRKILAEAGPLPLRRIIAISRQVCEGLAHAHARNIVHRDIKPGNIVVGAEDRVKITDFGLAQPPQANDDALRQAIAGTPGYMAPEQLRGDRVDGRADIFAVGCVLYQMLTGRQPFEGATPASVIEKTLHAFPTDPSRVREDLPRTLDRIVGRALRKDPDERYNSVTQLQQDLVNYEQFEYLTEARTGAAEIAAALEARQCTLFLGLHLPVTADENHSSTSERLIAEYLGERLSSPPKERGLSRLAQELEMERGRPEMLKFLTAAVRNPRASPRELIRRVARLPFPVIVTTGYDTFLEDELAKVNRKVRRVINCRSVPDDPAEADLLVRLFGSVDSEASIVVTEDDLWNFFGSFHSLSDALKSLFARHRLLFIGYDPEDEGFRHLFSEIARFRVGTTEGCYLATTDAVLPTVRWAQRKALRLIDADPAAFLSLLEETITERRRQKRASKEEHYEAPLPIRPYKFLNYYDRDDERIFFGRQSETLRLLTKIHAYPLNVLYAPSGSGKTSLICAGLMPQLRRQGYTPVYCRVYDDPAGEIRRAALEAVGAPASDFPAAMPLQELLPEIAARHEQRLVIFVDQFEEIFIRHDHEARDRFASSLAAILTEGKGRVRFVLSLREDFLARLSDFRERIPNIFHNEFRLAPLTDAESRASIVEPAQLLGLEVEPGLVDRLIADLSREGVDPPQLQIVCDTLYDALEHGEKQITLKSYLALGETRKILGNYLERVLREFPPPERDAARELLKSLVTSEKTKTVAQIADLARAAGRPEEEASKILSDLSNRRLIRRVQRDEGYWYELTHEYLVEEISRWLSEKEMQLKKLRELLEQAIRNHRNLGILMPAAQLRLVQAQEDDLNLSKEERQFLRESAQALTTRRRNIVIATAAALVVLMIGGIVWRYIYLASHVYIKSEDKEFIEYDYGRKQPHRLENIRVYSGSPASWWLDKRLGFPKPIYQTDFELGQLDPVRRDSLKVGRIVSRGTDLETEIVKMLQPDVQARFLITTGRLDEAIKQVPQLYKNPSVDQNSVNEIIGMLGYSGVSDERFIQNATTHALLTRSPSRMGSYRSLKLYLINLLGNLPSDVCHRLLVPFLSVPLARRDALELLGSLGDKADAATVAPFLSSRFEPQQSFDSPLLAALMALNHLGDCSALPRVRQFIARDDFLTVREILPYVRSCGNQTDLVLLEQAARRDALETNGSGAFVAARIVETIYDGWGHASVPTILSILASTPMGPGKVQALQNIKDPDVSTDLASLTAAAPALVRAQAATALAELGDRRGLTPAAAIARNQQEELNTRTQALEAFRWFKGPEIEVFLLTMIKASKPEEAEIRAGSMTGLRWYDDDAARSTLLEGLADRDELVREAALESFGFNSTESRTKWLEGELGSLRPAQKVYAARALQLVSKDNHASVFTQFLKERADEAKDYPATVEAMVGLRDAYIMQPTAESVDALGDPNREVRLAATLALIERGDYDQSVELLKEAEKHNDNRFQTAARRALWGISVERRSEALLERAQAELAGGNSRLASQLLDRVYDPENFGGMNNDSALEAGLSVSKSSDEFAGPYGSYLFESIFDPTHNRFKLLRCELTLKNASVSSAQFDLNSILSDDPALRNSLAQDPNLASLRSVYEFRVLTGLQQPTEIDNLKLPDPSSQSR